MASIKTKFTVGLFIAAGLAIAVVAIIWLGMSKYLEKGQLYAAYFDESIQGLDRDSPVKYRGVPVGRVQRIGVAPDGALVQVVMKIETRLESEKEVLADIVAQLKSVGITGIMFVELDRKKNGDPDFLPKLTFESDYPVIATRPSEIKMFLEGVDDVLKQLKSIDGKGLSDGAMQTLAKFDQMIDDIQLKQISTEIKTMLRHLNRIITANEPAITTAVEEAHRAIQSVEKATAKLDQLIGDNQDALARAFSGFSQSAQNLAGLLADGRQLVQQGDRTLIGLQPRLLVAMQQLEETIQNLKKFSEDIARQPSQLLFGDPPIARSVEPE